MAITKTPVTADIDKWEEIAQNATRTGTVKSISADYGATLYIDYAQTNATAHTGTQITVLTSSSDAGNGTWSSYSWVSKTGTGNVEFISDVPVNDTSLFVASLTGYTTDGVTECFLEDVTVFSDSELVRVVSTAGTSDIFLLHGVIRAHASDSIMNNITQTYKYKLDDADLRFQVIGDNTFDPDGATVATRVRLVEITAV